MESVQESATELPTDRQPMSDDDILRLLADQRGAPGRMAIHFCVSQKVIYDRLIRLTLEQSVTRRRDDSTRKQGRPRYLYFITSQGTAALATAAK